MTDGKSYTGYRLIPKLVTLNDLEKVTNANLRYYPECTNFQSQWRHTGWR